MPKLENAQKKLATVVPGSIPACMVVNEPGGEEAILQGAKRLFVGLIFLLFMASPSMAIGPRPEFELLFCHDSSAHELYRALRYEGCRDGQKKISRSKWIELAREYKQISEEEYRFFKDTKPKKMNPNLEATSNGTAFSINSNGMTVTSYHVVGGCKEVVLMSEVDLIPTTIVASSKDLDLAVLKSRFVPRGIAKLREKPMDLGEHIYAFGFPYVTILRTLNMSDGIVSGVRVLGVPGLMQLSTPLQPGNSGGPLFDVTGSVAGVVSARMTEGQNVGFGVQGDVLVRFLKSEKIEFDAAEASGVLTTTAIAKIARQFTRPLLCLTEK